MDLLVQAYPGHTLKGSEGLSAPGSSELWLARPVSASLLATAEAGASPQINIVENWFEELRRLVPTD